MTRAVAILLIFCSLSVCLSAFIVNIGFEMNRAYIATEFCINKDQPQLHCNGKCYLMKKLKQAEEKEQKQAHELLKIQLQQPLANLRVEFTAYTDQMTPVHIPYSTGKPLSKVNPVFQPPQEG